MQDLAIIIKAGIFPQKRQTDEADPSDPNHDLGGSFPCSRSQSTSAAHGGNPSPVPGRSVITTKSGIQVLERGGNAIAAAIATNAVLGRIG
jgi:gamma-glutamyltranspeptidase